MAHSLNRHPRFVNFWSRDIFRSFSPAPPRNLLYRDFSLFNTAFQTDWLAESNQVIANDHVEM